VRIDVDDSGATADLLGVHVAAANDALAVGRGGTILRWNGARWLREDAGTDEDLYAVCADGDVLHAVGGNLRVGKHSLVARCSDGRWAIERSPIQSVLLSVGAARGRVRAVGFNGGIVERAAGGWRELAATTNAHLFSIRALDDARWLACGLNGTIVELDGDVVRETTACDAHLTSIAIARDRVVAVGFDGTVVERARDGWRPVASPTREHLWAAWIDERGRVVAVGAHGTVVVEDAGRLVAITPPVEHDLHALSGAGPLAIAVGRHGTVIRIALGGS
jgi:hypothetical protein